MKNMKILLFSLAIAVIALTSFQSIAAAAQVTKINANRGFIFINGSIADGFVLGAEVCFYSTSSKKNHLRKSCTGIGDLCQGQDKQQNRKTNSIWNDSKAF